jgi:hypothetical protein
VVSILTPAEILIAARRLAGARPHLAAAAGIVHREDLWQLRRDELTGADVRIDGRGIRGRWFAVVGATPRLGGAAARRDDPLTRDRRSDRTARTPRLALTRWSRALTGLGGDFAAGARSRVSFGTRFVLYQRNIENLCKDRATVCEEIRKSVAELYDAALESRATIAIKGAPEQHAEGANIPGDKDG